jgi:2-polyprenyl-3-methyl-5-hydroxy-6-metoxy-1,4-benzoquinol methylase
MDENTLKDANDTMYNKVSQRVDIYCHKMRAHFRARYKNILKLIMAQNPSGNKVLEIGSNVGYTLNLIKDIGFDIKGCELNDKCREISKLLWDIPVEKDFFEMDEKFDIIIMSDVLEHFQDPVAALQKTYSLLNKDGLLFIQLPNIISKECKKQKEKWWWWSVPDHRFHFTPNSISILLNNNNFTVEYLQTVTPINVHPLLRLIRPRRFIAKFVKIFDSFVPCAFYRSNGGGLIQIIARKKI